MLKKLFGGKKKSNFYLELKDNEEQKSDATVAQTAAAVVGTPEAKPEKAPELVTAPDRESTAEKAPAPSAEQKKSQKTSDSEKAPASKAEQKKSQKTLDKKTKAKGKEKEKAQAAPAPAPASKIPDAEELARIAVSSSSSVNGKVESQEVLFAANSIVAPTMSRRRPGPSLNAFKDMARKAKVPTSRR